MIHWTARKLLAQLPDDSLLPATEIELRAHVASCAQCRNRLHEMQVSEDLLRRIPPSIIPIEAAPNAYVRLAALARWTEEGEIADPQGWRLSMLGVASVVLLFCLAASAGSWAPTITPGFGSSAVSMESLPPNYAYMPIHYR